MEWAGERLNLDGGGFVQVNGECGLLLHRYLLDEAGDVAGQRIVDAYCGAGVLGRALAGKGGDVVGIDLDPAGQDVGEPGLDFTMMVGRVEEELPKSLPADLVLLNPPRTGLDKSIPELLVKDPPSKALYVSCDPATLARDLKRLEGAFQVERVRCFDLFPQTGHVETVVTLRKAEGGNG
jgi:23S rRNA (uracil1939-C5)-methyltransferase